MQGFIVCVDGKPVPMALSEDITGGIVVNDPVQVFDSADAAGDAAMSNQSQYGSKAVFEIRHVELVIGDVHHTAEYDESTDLDEDEDEGS
jgi:hypothetical protein